MSRLESIGPMSGIHALTAGTAVAAAATSPTSPKANQEHHHQINIMRQLRCYLCDTPKQEYSLINTFTEVVCRGCVNFEGPDRVEQLISEARRVKTTPDIYEPPTSQQQQQQQHQQQPASQSTTESKTTTTNSSTSNNHNSNNSEPIKNSTSSSPESRDDLIRKNTSQLCDQEPSMLGSLLHTPPAQLPAPPAQVIPIQPGQCYSPNSLAALAGTTTAMPYVVRPGESPAILRCDPGLARAFAYAGLQPHQLPNGTITLNTSAGYGQFDLFQPHPSVPLCNRPLAHAFNESHQSGKQLLIKSAQQQSQFQSHHLQQQQQQQQQQHNQSQQQQQHQQQQSRQAGYRNNHPSYILSQHHQNQAALAASGYDPADFCLSNHPPTHQATINGGANNNNSMSIQQQAIQHRSHPDLQLRRINERCCDQYAPQLTKHHPQQQPQLQQVNPLEQLQQVVSMKEKAAKSAREKPARQLADEQHQQQRQSDGLPRDLSAEQQTREKRNLERNSSPRSLSSSSSSPSSPAPPSDVSPKPTGSVLRSRKQRPVEKSAGSKEERLEIDMVDGDEPSQAELPDEPSEKTTAATTTVAASGGATSNNTTKERLKRPNNRSANYSPLKRLYNGELSRYSVQATAQASNNNKNIGRLHGQLTNPIQNQNNASRHDDGSDQLNCGSNCTQQAAREGGSEKSQALNLSHPLAGANGVGRNYSSPRSQSSIPALNSNLRGANTPTTTTTTTTSPTPTLATNSDLASNQSGYNRSKEGSSYCLKVRTEDVQSANTTATTAATETTAATASPTTTLTNNPQPNPGPHGQPGRPQSALPSSKYEPLKCSMCSDRLEDRHFVQCPTVSSHKFCFSCSKISIQQQRFDIQLAIDSGNHGRPETEKSERCLLTNERSPWTFMTNEIETIYKENCPNGPTNKSHYLSKSNSKSNRVEPSNHHDKS